MAGALYPPPEAKALMRYTNTILHIYYFLMSGPMDDEKWKILVQRELLTEEEAEKLQLQAADRGAAEKNRKWLGHTIAQGDIFMPLCHEHPGTMGEGALAVLERAAAHFSSSMAQRGAFKT
eukprot:CAMPEP_0114391982 /NCGR_PEP_ID=MMETSP0102-20121206/10486_1 /TAXON_ID=38822 ORGANISM="Pteridomonas danica, Strain PT" /NCGR_SAMPLE_ID=MMETSP0102 /ASSEMBLY_ACC=CAM_ASM_000212 /LENGTH=120 /DNA_ID=CAMNT_0001550993 /DNA_START=375 /DNA_END=734 /DNA_ORIENTATION=+